MAPDIGPCCRTVPDGPPFGRWAALCAEVALSACEQVHVPGASPSPGNIEEPEGKDADLRRREGGGRGRHARRPGRRMRLLSFVRVVVDRQQHFCVQVSLPPVSRGRCAGSYRKPDSKIL